MIILLRSDTSDQAKCLNDLPKVMEQYDYLSAQKLPGILYSALEQCVKAFGEKFVPHVKSDSPYEDLCRELWCANDSHALRAHPALEGTDCSSKPYPYGSVSVLSCSLVAFCKNKRRRSFSETCSRYRGQLKVIWRVNR